MAKQKQRGHGEGSIYQRKDKRWVASFKPEGEKRIYLYGKTRKEAYDKLQKAIQEEKQGILAKGPDRKVGDYLKQWLETIVKPLRRKNTYRQYRSMVNAHLIPAFGEMALRKLTVQHIQVLYAEKLETGSSPATVAVIHAILHKALENAVGWNLISRNVAESVTLPGIPRYEGRFLTQEEARKLFTVAKGTRLEVLLIVAITTGMRRGELLALRWDDVNLENGTLRVERTMSRVAGSEYIENAPKTKSSRRKIMLPGIAVKALREHCEKQGQERRSSGDVWQDRNLVFSGLNGRYWAPESMGYQFRKLLVEAGLPRMRFHDLRHSAASILLAMGVHPKVVQELLGHSTITVTMDRYSHLFPSMQNEARNKMDDAFNDM